MKVNWDSFPIKIIALSLVIIAIVLVIVAVRMPVRSRPKSNIPAGWIFH